MGVLLSIGRARELRRSSGSPERKMWELLYPLRRAGFHFRRQVQIGSYFADFACHHAKLVIEVDGITHVQSTSRTRDKARDAYFESRGFRVLRFWNNEVIENPEGVQHVIAQALGYAEVLTPTPDPSPQGGGRRRKQALGNMADTREARKA